MKNKWKFVKSIVGSRKNTPGFTEDAAHQMNLSFCNVFKPEDIQEFDVSRYSLVCEHDDSRIEAYEVDFLLKHIKSLATGPDCIPGLAFKLFSEFLAEPLAFLYNMSLKHGIIPSLWKLANVIPIPKSKEEFRPISLLCIPMKILEKLVLSKWLSPSFQRPFCASQFAFVPNTKYGGCCNALTLATSWTLQALDKGAEYIRWLAIDFRKAFDTVSHKKILNTLVNHFRVSGKVVSWLHNYFTARMQGVVYKNIYTSPYLECSSGVPQGSILGPVLFAMLLDPCIISDKYANSKLVYYADDCTLLSSVFPNQPDFLQDDADLFISSTKEQGLEINPGKCQIISFRARSSIVIPPVVSLNSVPVTQVSSIKILGVWFTSDLKWTLHLDYTYKKCARASFFIKMLYNRGVRGHLLRTICDSLVFSHLTYCWPVICNCTNLALKRFILLDSRMMKLCRSSYNTSALRSRLDRQCSRLAKKICGHEGHPLEMCFERNVSSSTMILRKHKKFHPVYARKTMLRNSFTKFAL
jgi:hypothetical protein